MRRIGVLVMISAAAWSGCAWRESYSYERVALRQGPLAPAAAGTDLEEDLSRPLSVWDAIRIGLRSNPDVAAAAARVDQARAGLISATAPLLPNLQLTYGYTRADQPSLFLFKKIDGRELPMTVDFNNPGTFDAHTTSVTLHQSLFAGGRNLLRRWIAQLTVEAGQRGRDIVENDLIHAIIRTYYDAQTAADLVQTAQQSARTVEAQLKERRAKFEAGAEVLKSDVLSLEVRLAEAREQEIATANAHRLMLTALAVLMGLDADTELNLSGEDWEPVPLPAEYEAGLAEALARRPELDAVRLAVRQAAMQVDAEKGRRLPSVDFVARYNFDSETMDYAWGDRGWMVGVNLRYGVFEGGRRRGSVRRAEAQLDEMLRIDRRAVLAVQAQVRQAYLRLDEAKARLAVAGAAVGQAEESLALVKNQYQAGRATVTRYLEAELALTAARSRRTRATYDVKRAKADVGHALGLCVECARRARRAS